MTEKIAVLKVNGMHCQSCADAIGAALCSEKGVKNARVEFEKKRVTISFDTSKMDQGKIRNVIARAGYTVA